MAIRFDEEWLKAVAERALREEEEMATRTLPPVRVPHPHVYVDPAVGEGSPMIEGTRVAVRRLFSWHRQGTTVETLLRRYPQIGPARVFDALAFAYDNLDLITADLVREREDVAKETNGTR